MGSNLLFWINFVIGPSMAVNQIVLFLLDNNMQCWRVGAGSRGAGILERVGASKKKYREPEPEPSLFGGSRLNKF